MQHVFPILRQSELNMEKSSGTNIAIHRSVPTRLSYRSPVSRYGSIDAEQFNAKAPWKIPGIVFRMEIRKNSVRDKRETFLRVTFFFYPRENVLDPRCFIYSVLGQVLVVTEKDLYFFWISRAKLCRYHFQMCTSTLDGGWIH